MNYTCPECKTTHSSSEWDKATAEKYDENEDLTSIESDEMKFCYFQCPNCGDEIDGNEIIDSDSDNVTITKTEYNELLEIKAMYEGLCK